MEALAAFEAQSLHSSPRQWCIAVLVRTRRRTDLDGAAATRHPMQPSIGAAARRQHRFLEQTPERRRQPGARSARRCEAMRAADNVDAEPGGKIPASAGRSVQYAHAGAARGR